MIIDEQILRARLAALDIVQKTVGSGDPATLLLVAEPLETWLLRPPLVDQRPGATMPNPATGNITVHHAETTADRLGYERCSALWQTTGGRHECRYAPHDGGDHACTCGEEW